MTVETCVKDLVGVDRENNHLLLSLLTFLVQIPTQGEEVPLLHALVDKIASPQLGTEAVVSPGNAKKILALVPTYNSRESDRRTRWRL